MANLSFAQFIEQQDSIKDKKTYDFSDDFSVEQFYSDYVSWLRLCSRRASTPYRFTATEMLTQLKIINAYVLFLIEHYKRTKTLEKPIKLPLVPETLTAHNTQAHDFELPPSNYVTAHQKKCISSNYLLRAKFYSYLSAALVVLASIHSALMAFLPGSTLIAQTIGFFLFTFCATLSLKLLFTDGSFNLNSHKAVTTQDLTYSKVTFALNAIIMACTVGGFVLGVHSPLLFILAAAAQLPFALQLSSRIHNNLNASVWDDFTENMPETAYLALLPSGDSLTSALQAPEQANTESLTHAITATTHCLLTSRLQREISEEKPTTKMDDEISIDYLAYRLNNRKGAIGLTN